MNDHDELSDSAVLSTVRESISGLPMPTAPRLDAITGRARARRRRRLGGLSLAAAGACAALVVGLAGSPGSAGPAHSALPASHHQVPAIHLAAFSVVADADGGTTLTLHPGEVADPNAVRQALAEHGIPALVTANEFCRTAVQPAPGVGDVVILPQGPMRQVSSPDPAKGVGGSIVIYGARIPSGVELSIGYRQDSQQYEISFTLIVTGAPLTCTSIPDNGPHPDDGPSA
jgi:hypothetical protein